MKALKILTCSCLATTFLIGCGEDEYVYPDLVTEIVCLKTDASGIGTRIVTDGGTEWNLLESNRPDGLTADSTYRMLCKYAPLNETDIRAYTLQSVIATLPKPADSYESVKTDPVSIQSIWRSGDYLNMVLQVKVKDGKHELSFADHGITTTDGDGTQTLTLTLHHDRKDDVEGFDRKAYLSVPLWHYRDRLQEGDRIVFRLNTYEEGMTERTFTY